MADRPEGTVVSRPRNPGLTPAMLNHIASVTHDVEATYDFYTRIMGMEVASTVIDDRIPSTGDAFPYFHIFFKMNDGSTIAFFEAPGLPAPAVPTHPAYDIFTHVALEVPSRDDVMKWYKWLQLNKIEVVGPTDHGFIYSVYFHDPNGIRLEVTAPNDKNWNNHTSRAKEDFALWVGAKARAKADGLDVNEALLKITKERRSARDAENGAD
jgi:catechol 2,3-dioxygenase-like lactoylglutathione lyase family enzyme